MTELAVPTPVTVTEHVVRIGPADPESRPYVTLPFWVPAGIRAFRLSLAYEGRASTSDATDGNLLDLGLLAPGPTDVGAASFRGWSGSERATVVVGETAATPGYRPGPLEAGTWHVLLGCYRIVQAGCEARVAIETLADMPSPSTAGTELAGRPRPRRRHSQPTARMHAMAPAATRRWIPIDLHAHTIHSDGSESIEALAARAAERGLEALFVTDHNTDAHLPHLSSGNGPILLLPGEEVTTYGGHLNALGISSWVEFRHEDAGGVATALAVIHEQGGLASINHPASVAIPWRYGPDLDVDAVEVWNGPWSPEDDTALAIWDSIIDTGRRIVAVGGSDTHGPEPGEQPVGTPTTWVEADGDDERAILDALRAGRAALTTGPVVRPPRLEVATARGTRRVGDPPLPRRRGDPVEVRWTVVPGGSGPIADGTEVRVVVDGVQTVAVSTRLATGSVTIGDMGHPSRVRLEVRAGNGALIALTNHAYIEETA